MRGVVKVNLWGTTIGYLGYAPKQRSFATFEYDPDFLKTGVQVSPLQVAYPPSLFTFNQLPYNTFYGLPGFIADSLPDSFGNQLIDIYLSQHTILPNEVTALDRLNYVSNRGMGALEYHPGETLPLKRTAFDLTELNELANLVQESKERLHDKLLSTSDRATALSMIRIGSSAGGARSKALVALSKRGNFFDGTVNHGPDYTYWLLKFDSVTNRDRDSSDPKGMPILEYIYSKIAREVGIEIPHTDLIFDGEDTHFLIERFDRIIVKNKLDKLHYVSWSGLDHADRDGINSYEQLVLISRKMRLGAATEMEIFRRAVFNIIGRNQDDHTKNTGFLMDRSGTWRLSPAFDLTYSYDPKGRFTRNHQCWLNKKNHDFTYKDLLRFGRFCNLRERKIREIIEQVGEAFLGFSHLAKHYELPEELCKTVEQNLRLSILAEN